MLEHLPYFISMLFTMALIVYSLFFLYILYLEKKSLLNWLFAWVCLAMVIWSLAFAISTSAETLVMASLWHRVAVWGYGTIYSLLLHFVIILTKNEGVFRHKTVYGIIYIPAFLNILFYSIKTPWFPYEYTLKLTQAGWITYSNNSLMDWYFYAYFLLFVLITLSLLIQWRFKSKDPIVKSQFKVMFTSILIATVFGAVSDIVLADFLHIESPQIAPILILLPLFAAMYSSVEYGMMPTEYENKSTMILNSDIKNILYKYMSVAFAFVGLFSSLIKWGFFQRPLSSAIVFGAVIASFGIVLRLVINKNITEDNKDNLVLLVVSMIITFIIFDALSTGSTTLWAVPFLFIIAFMLYNQGKMLTGLSVTSVLALIVAGTIMQEVTTVVSQRDYTLRIILVSFAIIFAALINQIYTRRLKENANQLRDQQLIAEVSSNMVLAAQDDFDEKLKEVLAKVGRHYKMDRSYFFCFHEDRKSMSNSHEWCSEGVRPERMNLLGIPVNAFPWWMEQLMTNRVVSIPDVDLLPEEAWRVKQELQRQEVKSTMAVAVFVNDQQIGYFGVDAVKHKIEWREDITTNLHIIGNVLSDAFAKNNAEKVIHELAYYDQLTGLPTRQLFKDRLSQSMKMADRQGDKLVVALLDLDAFKVINDTMGHDKGDQLLVDVARRLEKTVRGSDTVCRFGGDEFLLLCNDIKDDDDALAIGEEIMAAFGELFVIDQDTFNVTSSMGIAVYPDDGQTAGKLIKNADIAMYHAKDLGKNTFALCNDHLKDRNMYSARLTKALSRALEKEELFMSYQPQVALSSGAVTGVEALIRWRHTELGLIEPTEFIHIAERNGYILDIGEWVLRVVFNQVKGWDEQGYDGFVVAINVSFIQMQHEHFIDLIQELMEVYEIEPGRVELEITESIAMDQNGGISRRLEKIRALGIQLAIDDFGTEYSSLGRLKDITVDKIKIAKPFIDGISKNEKDEAIVKSIIALAKNLKVKTIAEGVESDKQVDFLKQQGCDYIQGFYYYEPMLAEDMTAVLEKQFKIYRHDL